jgi:hypothetical protein
MLFLEVLKVGVGMVMVMMYDRCSVFDESEASLRFDEEIDMYLGIF